MLWMNRQYRPFPFGHRVGVHSGPKGVIGKA